MNNIDKRHPEKVEGGVLSFLRVGFHLLRVVQLRINYCILIILMLVPINVFADSGMGPVELSMWNSGNGFEIEIRLRPPGNIITLRRITENTSRNILLKYNTDIDKRGLISPLCDELTIVPGNCEEDPQDCVSCDDAGIRDYLLTAGLITLKDECVPPGKVHYAVYVHEDETCYLEASWGDTVLSMGQECSMPEESFKCDSEEVITWEDIEESSSGCMSIPQNSSIPFSLPLLMIVLGIIMLRHRE